MASSLRLCPGGMAKCARPNITFTQPFAYSLQSRAFSETSQRWAYRSQNFNPRSPSMPSMKARQKDALANQRPNDLGLLPGTFVRPLWRDLPSIFSQPRDRLHMEWITIKSFFQNYISLWQYCKEQETEVGIKARRQRAQLLYKDMYTAFARGDTSGLKRLCCDGLAKDLIGQIDRRPKGMTVTWKLTKWLRQPSTFFRGVRVVSDRATSLPNLPKSGIRQIVLRVTSRQVMAKSTAGLASTAVTEASAKEKSCMEYLVIQELRWSGESSWRVWGFAKPTDLQTALNDPAFAPGLSMLDRMKAMQGQ